MKHNKEKGKAEKAEVKILITNEFNNPRHQYYLLSQTKVNNKV